MPGDANSGFTGNVTLSGTANVNANGEIQVTLKRTGIWFVCVPYGVKFRYARVNGTAQIDQGATVKQLHALLEKNHAEVLASRPWAEQKLAYPIKKGNTAMADQVNSTLKRLTDDGSLKKYETTWFGEAAK